MAFRSALGYRGHEVSPETQACLALRGYTLDTAGRPRAVLPLRDTMTTCQGALTGGLSDVFVSCCRDPCLLDRVIQLQHTLETVGTILYLFSGLVSRLREGGNL